MHVTCTLFTSHIPTIQLKEVKRDKEEHVDFAPVLAQAPAPLESPENFHTGALPLTKNPLTPYPTLEVNACRYIIHHNCM